MIAIAPSRLWTMRLASLSLTWVVLGVVAATKIVLVGEIRIGEIVALALLPFLLLQGRVSRHAVWLMGLAAVWSAGQFISDLVNHTAVSDMLKGVFAPLVLAGTATSLLLLFGPHPKRIPPFLLGMGIELILQVLTSPTESQLEEPWKWGIGFGVLFIGLVMLSFFRARSWIAMVLATGAFALICLYYSARSLAMFPVVGLLVYMFWTARWGGNFKRWLQGNFGALKLAALIVLAVVSLNSALTLFFSSGLLDPYLTPEVAQKYRLQASSEVGVLLAGRSESLISLKAYADAPILGHGSWAQDKADYIDQYISMRYRYGIQEEDKLEDDSTLIPAHSYLMGAMVWAGLAGGVFWVLLTWRITSIYLSAAPLLPLYFHVGMVSYLWNLLFSPFGATARWELAVFFAVLLAYGQQKKLRSP